MKVTITEQYLHNIIAESVKKNLLEFNHMLYGHEPEPESRYGTVNFVEGTIENSEVDLDYDTVVSVLNKLGLPIEMDVSYPESDSLDNTTRKKFKELCEKIESINPSSDVERVVLSQYLDAVYNIEEYYLVQKYYGTELDIPDYSPDPDDEYDSRF